MMTQEQIKTMLSNIKLINDEFSEDVKLTYSDQARLATMFGQTLEDIGPPNLVDILDGETSANFMLDLADNLAEYASYNTIETLAKGLDIRPEPDELVEMLTELIDENEAHNPGFPEPGQLKNLMRGLKSKLQVHELELLAQELLG